MASQLLYILHTGIIQLAKSPVEDISIAPNIVKFTCPPRIIAKLSSEAKNEAPGKIVTLSFPAFINSGSSWKRNIKIKSFF